MVSSVSSRLIRRRCLVRIVRDDAIGAPSIFSSNAGELSRLGGGELRPVSDRDDEVPGRRLIGRWSCSDALEIMLEVDNER